MVLPVAAEQVVPPDRAVVVQVAPAAVAEADPIKKAAAIAAV